MCCVFFAAGFAGATEQQFYDVGEDEVFEEKYEGYKTTLDRDFRGAFSDEPELYQDVRSTGGVRYQAGSLNKSYQNQFNSLFDQGEFGSLTQGGASELHGMFARDDTLVKELSLPQPRYFNQGLVNKNHSAGFKSNTGAGSGGNKNTKKSKSTSYEYEESPAVIRWIFSTISYVREHPVITGIILLVVFSVISLLQAVVQGRGKPLAARPANSFGRSRSGSHRGRRHRRSVSR